MLVLRMPRGVILSDERKRLGRREFDPQRAIPELAKTFSACARAKTLPPHLLARDLRPSSKKT